MISKETLVKIKSGAVVAVTEIIRDKEKERTSVFKGIVIARKHGSQDGATFTVRSLVGGVGVEKIYPINSPDIGSVKVVSFPKKPTRSKLYYLRNISKKRSREKIGVAI
ncbi:MAG: 50S ribosomal protein L19 [Candidatus Paceibacterota bacterium]|jgi:large subunit ribosomal protein L19